MKPPSHIGRAPHAPQQAQAGAASLIVVMVLFFLMALVAAYTSRNLIFEQRTSVNQYRATQAYEAAEAGLEWALTMLNSGRIGPNCLETGASSSDTSFRQRYLDINVTTGAVAPRSAPAVGTNLWPSCVSDGAGGWNCDCPSNAAPNVPPPPSGGVFPAFRVRFTNQHLSRPGLIRIESNGCTLLDDDCLNHPGDATGLEGRASVAAIVALTSALPTPPGAALTVLGNVAGGSAMSVYNTDAELGGITVQSGGLVTTTGWTLRSVPGTPGRASVAQGEVALSALVGEVDRAFASVFNMWPATYRAQPAALRLDCPVGGCSADLANLVNMNPDRVIWVNAPQGLTLESAVTIGSTVSPALIVVDGPLNFAVSGVRIHGFVYSRGGNWQGAGQIHGAAFVEGDLAGTAAATVVMDNTTLKTLRRRAGSFVRAPGGWDDFRKREP